MVRFLLVVAALALGAALTATSPAGATGLSLDSCVTRALAGNPELRAMERELEAARSRARQARAFQPPSLSVEAGKLGTPISDEEREQSWRLSQVFPTQRGRSGAVATLDADRIAVEREATRLRLRGEVARTYRRLQADILTLRALESLYATASAVEEMTRVRLGSGAARYLDVLRARVERARLDNDVIEARRSLAEHRRALNLLMARGPEEPLEPADSIGFAPFTVDLDMLIAEARRTRPRLQAAELQVRREAAALALARASWIPSPEVAAGMDRVPGTSVPGFGGSVALDLPFLPWTDRGARIDETRASSAGAQARLEAARLGLDAAIRTAYEGARAAEAQAATFEQTLLGDADDAIQSATRGYSFGQVDGTDLFESFRTLRTVQLERIRALLGYALALIDLQTTE